MTVRKNGADTGTLKTRMGFLIRRSGCIMAWAYFGRDFLIERAWATKGLAGASAHPKQQIVVPAKGGPARFFAGSSGNLIFAIGSSPLVRRRRKWQFMLPRVPVSVS